jgi:hypothetical protein
VLLRYAQKLLSWRMAHAEHTLTHIQLTGKGPVGYAPHQYAAGPS